MTRLTTYYDTLQVARSANEGVIRAAYRSLSQKYHPDRHPDKLEWANKAMQRLNEAYAVLSDPGRRAAYDKRLSEHEAARHHEAERAEQVRWVLAEHERRSREEAEVQARDAEDARLEQAKAEERERADRLRRLRAQAYDVQEIEKQVAIEARGPARSKKPIGWRSLVACLALAGFAGSYFGIVGFGGAISGVVPGAVAGFAFWCWLRRKTGASGYTFSDTLGRAAASMWKGCLVLLKWSIVAGVVATILGVIFNDKRSTTPTPQTASIPTPEKSLTYETPTYSAPTTLRPQPTPVDSQAQYDATVSRLEQLYLEINPESSLYSQRKVDIVMALARDYVSAGMSRSRALERAADEALNPFSRAQR